MPLLVFVGPSMKGSMVSISLSKLPYDLSLKKSIERKLCVIRVSTCKLPILNWNLIFQSKLESGHPLPRLEKSLIEFGLKTE